MPAWVTPNVIAQELQRPPADSRRRRQQRAKVLENLRDALAALTAAQYGRDNATRRPGPRRRAGRRGSSVLRRLKIENVWIVKKMRTLRLSRAATGRPSMVPIAQIGALLRDGLTAWRKRPSRRRAVRPSRHQPSSRSSSLVGLSAGVAVIARRVRPPPGTRAGRAAGAVVVGAILVACRCCATARCCCRSPVFHSSCWRWPIPTRRCNSRR